MPDPTEHQIIGSVGRAIGGDAVDAPLPQGSHDNGFIHRPCPYIQASTLEFGNQCRRQHLEIRVPE